MLKSTRDFESRNPRKEALIFYPSGKTNEGNQNLRKRKSTDNKKNVLFSTV